MPSLSNLYIYAIWIQNLFSEHKLVMNKPCKSRINNISSQCINQTKKKTKKKLFYQKQLN
jgi:hypothetical protein